MLLAYELLNKQEDFEGAFSIVDEAFPTGHTQRAILDEWLNTTKKRIALDTAVRALNLHSKHIVEEGIRQLSELDLI